MSRRVPWIILLFGILVALVYFSSHLAALRIYQVDECQNLYMARILAMGQSSDFFTNASLFLLGPLSWIARNATRSTDAFQTARLIFLGVFWLNLFLMALIAAERLYSFKALLALVVAATLTPLWDYGFEVRHDNLVLTGVLLTWWVIRVKPMGAISYFIAGATAITLLFIAVKAVVYVLPLSVAILLFPPPAYSLSRVRLGLVWVAGVALGTALIRILYGVGGGWVTYVSVFHGVAKYSAGGGGGSPGFAAWSTLGRLPGQTPLLLGLIVAACFGLGVDLVRRGRAAIGWEGCLPEFLLLLGSFGALLINPTPFPYNLLHVVPYAFIFAFRYTASIWNEIWNPPALRPVLAGILIFTHAIPFAIATHRHLDHLNWRQEKLMSLAEDLTNPNRDPVYDGIGMVPTRPTIHFQWFLHSLNIQSFLNGNGPRICDILSRRPAAVIIPNYRTDWLSDADHDYIKEHYVALADDFLVLGKVLAEGGGTFEIIHPGRYRISTLKGSDLENTYELGLKGVMIPEDPGTLTARLDGKPLTNRPVELCAGVHRLECAPDCQPAIVWMGPHLDRVHRLGPGDHRVLFYNWY